jgi:long-chain acyl-CoA synthetase
MIGWLVNRPDLDHFDLSSLRYMGYGASAVPEPVIRRALELFPQLTFNQFYGQTEAGGGAVTLRAHQHSLDPSLSHRLRSAGQPINGARVEIQDEGGAEVPRGTWGEICIRSDGLFSGYLNNPERTAQALRDGWLHTGDVGFMDEDGFVYVTDRLKDMIVTGGENVSSSEVEDVILQHPAVASAAVVACPDSDWGERVHAVVVLREGAEVTESEIIDFCRGRIANYKRPKSVSLQREPLPMSAVGKVRKDLLRSRLLEAAGKVEAA